MEFELLSLKFQAMFSYSSLICSHSWRKLKYFLERYLFIFLLVLFQEKVKEVFQSWNRMYWLFGCTRNNSKFQNIKGLKSTEVL